MPRSFIIDENSVIRDAEADPDYAIRPESEHILSVLKNIMLH